MKAQKYTKETILAIGEALQPRPQIHVGDCVRIAQRVIEGEKERVQYFEGDVIAMHRHGIASTITVRKIGANGVAIERVLPLFSPTITNIAVVSHGVVRRAKLYYVRSRVGKHARVVKSNMKNDIE